ncbi:MAG: MerR family transcriptional regulator [Chloroflexota bacterium]
MYRIGDFARLGRVSVKTLRYYDDLGLLRPLQIDRASGYRYYSAEQLPRLNRILAYKDLGFSLEQVARLLDEDLPAAQLRGMLRLKQAELQQRLNEDRERLGRVEARLQQIEQEDQMPDYEVVVKPVPAMLVASAAGTAPNYEGIGPIFDRLFDEVYAYVQAQGGRAGCGIALYLHEGEQEIQIAALAPLQALLPASERIEVYELPGTPAMACTVHHGPFATIGGAYQALMNWAQANGWRIAGPARELYLQYERGGNQAQYVTEVQFPVARG